MKLLIAALLLLSFKLLAQEAPELMVPVHPDSPLTKRPDDIPPPPHSDVPQGVDTSQPLPILQPPATLAPPPPKPAITLMKASDIPDVAAYNTLLNTRYSLFTHKRTYLLPFSKNWKPHEEIYSSLSGYEPRSQPFYDQPEAEFQISFFLPVYRRIVGSNWDLLFAYTHHSWWQLYNSAWSRPFRETNYNPELFMRHIDENPIKFSHFRLLAYDVGYMHESNGQVQALSRSWDRIFGRAYMIGDSYSMSMTAWIRIPEDDDKDDNPDILRYKGIGELEYVRRFNIHTLELRVPLAAKPSVEFQYSYPWHDHLRWFVSTRYGYGHSLIEYDKEIMQVGIGVAVENFLDESSKK